jgi:hypothetical protein
MNEECTADGEATDIPRGMESFCGGSDSVKEVSVPNKWIFSNLVKDEAFLEVCS